MLVSPLILLTAACTPSSSGLVSYTDDPDGTVVTDTGVTVGDADLAGDIEITKITLNQGVQSVLFNGTGVPATLQAPVITNREGLLRVFVNPVDDFETRSIRAHLTIRQAGGEEIHRTAKRTIDGKSKNEDLKSTINFDLPAEDLKKSSELYVELREEDGGGPGGGDPELTTWDSEEMMPGGLPTEQSDEITIVIIPIRYNGDGSGRLPDTSDDAIADIQELAYAMYPASEVTIRVDPPQDWPSPVGSANINQWANLLDAVSDLRAFADEDPNTYYYGLFDPADSLFDYCNGVCTLGLSNLGWTLQQEYLRASIGLGFTAGNVAAETLVHEVGHAHGREHAPCGTSGDTQYPYANADIGKWGYDLVTEKQFDPDDTKDMMSYCSPIWVSDYTYFSLWERIAALSDQPRGSTMEVTRLRTDGKGNTRMRGTVPVRSLGGGIEVDVQLFDDQGADAGMAVGWLFPNSHFEGGVVTLDRKLPEGWTAEVL